MSDPTIATPPGDPMLHANPSAFATVHPSSIEADHQAARAEVPAIVLPIPPRSPTEADVQRARDAVPPGSATLSGTMTTVTPAAALVGLFAIWYASKYGHPLPDAGIIYATILVTTIAHGVKVLLTKLYPSVFSNAPPAEAFGYHDNHGHNP